VRQFCTPGSARGRQATGVPTLIGKKMKPIAAIFFLCFTMLASAGESLVSMTYSHTMRIPNSRVEVVVDGNGALALKTESRGKYKTSRKIQLSVEVVKQLRLQLEGLDWQKISLDKTRGLDGTSVRVTSAKHTATLWSPDYDPKKRGLVQIQKLIESIFDAAELDPTGMPKKKQNKPVADN
jgi:hypothetical protein